MLDHDFDRPYADQASMDSYEARHPGDARRFGKIVKAMTLTNREYQHRFHKLAEQHAMKLPPGSFVHIMMGYLVVRNLGTLNEYETWMPEEVFEELYVKTEHRATPHHDPPRPAEEH